MAGRKSNFPCYCQRWRRWFAKFKWPQFGMFSETHLKVNEPTYSARLFEDWFDSTFAGSLFPAISAGGPPFFAWIFDLVC